NIEIAGSKANFEWCSEKPNEMWIGKRESANQLLMRDPGLFTREAAALISFPGGHNEGFPDTSKQLFKEVYAAVREGKQPENPSFPTFADGLRELIICERIIESHRKQAWVKIRFIRNPCYSKHGFLFILIMEHIRKQLRQQILGRNAFKPIEEILEEVPFDKLGQQIEGLPYTFWQQFEHIRITQRH